MNMKITRLARGAKCGGLGASGFRSACAASDASPAKARYPKPQAARFRSARREVGSGCEPNMRATPQSIEVLEARRAIERLAQNGPGPGPGRDIDGRLASGRIPERRVDQGERRLDLGRPRGPPQDPQVEPIEQLML